LKEPGFSGTNAEDSVKEGVSENPTQRRKDAKGAKEISEGAALGRGGVWCDTLRYRALLVSD